MTSIETTQVDAYVQSTCLNRDMVPSARGRSGAAAIYSHVMQEFGLPMDTALEVENGVAEEHMWYVEFRGERAMDHLGEIAKEAMAAVQEEPDVSDSETFGILRIPAEMAYFSGQDSSPLLIADTAEGQSHHYNDKDE